MEHLLVQSNRLNGPHLARVTARPFRVAYVLPEHRLDVFERAVADCCLTWGGMYNFLVPASEGNVLSEQWLEILDAFDPDYLVDFAGLSEEIRSRFSAQGCRVEERATPLAYRSIFGTLQYSVLGELKARGLIQEPLVYPERNHDNPLYWSLLTRYGTLDESQLEGYAHIHYYIENFNLRYADVIEVTTISWADVDDLLLEMVARPEYGPAVYEDRGLLGATKLGLWFQRPNHFFFGRQPEIRQHDESYIDAIVVTGERPTVADLCLAWDLRAQRPDATILPLYLPLEYLQTDACTNLIRRAVDSQFPASPFLRSELAGLHIVSASMGQEELLQAVAGLGSRKVVNGQERIAAYVTNSFRLGVEETTREVLFADGVARLPHSEVSLPRTGPGDQLAVEIGVEGRKVPLSRSLRKNLPLFSLSRRFGKDGQILERSGRGDRSHVQIAVPDAWMVARSLFEDGGFEATLTPGARLLESIVRLCGGVGELFPLTSSLVFEVIAQLSQASGRQSYLKRLRELTRESGLTPEAVEDLVQRVGSPVAPEEEMRPHVPYARLRALLGSAKRDVVDTVVAWLLRQRLLLRGAALECTACGYKKWYALERLDVQYTCDGCMQVLPTPFGLEKLDWDYRINELCAKGFDQGVFPPILAIYRLWTELAHSGSGVDVLGFHGGVQLVPVAGQRTEWGDGLEIDIVGVVENRLVIGEAKVSGRALNTKTIEKYIRLATQLRASRLIFAVMEHGDVVRANVASVGLECPAMIEIYDGTALLDTAPWATSDGHQAIDYLAKMASAMGPGLAGA